MQLSRIRSNNKYQVLSLRQKPLVIYDEHRWILPAIVEAQEEGLVPRPCILVTFDMHHDGLAPRKGLGPIRKLRAKGLSYPDAVELVESHLSPLNDDWLKAGMELGIIGDVVSFGVHDRSDLETEFNDHIGKTRKIHFLHLPGGELGYQGALSDMARREQYQSVWDILGWEKRSVESVFQFVDGKDPIILDFDLDCFVIGWRDCLFSWPGEVYEKEFIRLSSYWSTMGLSGVDVVDGLASKAGLISIARSPNCCGGQAKAQKILEDVNRFLFRGDLLL